MLHDSDRSEVVTYTTKFLRLKLDLNCYYNALDLLHPFFKADLTLSLPCELTANLTGFYSMVSLQKSQHQM